MARGMICVSLAEKNAASLQKAVAPVLEMVDLIEVRLDCMEEPQVADFIAATDKPVLVTNRPAWEGGQWQGSESERAELLVEALDWGARYVDIELLAAKEIRAMILAKAKAVGGQVVISSHDFATTPASSVLEDRLEQMMESGADIAKIVVTAHDAAQCLRILSLQEKAMARNFPLSAFAMGSAGTISRLATLYLGGCMSYAALSPEQATAPGQLSVQELHAMLPVFSK
ncbi:type I 3-dehydroquinate dehydratase [Desulfobulbus rhabdoformis]|uniref:type I 3-dehydroquinate dehydratase n=1 Tax=Desulfobulbus rhabdoformis TaxID=34032 RepID=UPI0019625FD8|nr:type I 3-dehydroquinate dehydratase [Desulfobulbus rhabdoformis]MBM9616121.1 type I 3-dehydroquinate dehydratase [Desulfobulbus rhabdoformis]